jgi:hypothetical protein
MIASICGEAEDGARQKRLADEGRALVWSGGSRKMIHKFK